jgi:hypothetical protein
MKSFFLSLFVLVSLPLAYSQEKKFEEFKIDSEASYSSYSENAKKYLKQYFSSLKELGIAENNKFYISNIDLGRFTLDPFGVLAHLPEKEINCQFVFCKDIELQKRLNQEISNGRLVLVTHSWTNYNAAAMDSDSPVLQKIFDELDKKDLSGKSILIITPSTALDTLEHELYHADDHLNSSLKKLLEDLEFLITAGKTDCNTALKLISRSYVFEMRAYIHQENYLNNNVRPKEYLLKDSASGQIIEEVESMNYKENGLRMIKVKKDYYQARLDGAISKAVLSQSQLEDLRSMIEVLLSYKEP